MIFGKQMEGSYKLFIGLLIVAFIGFWPSYFVIIFGGDPPLTTYMHIHAFFALLWIGIVIVQPILILKRMNGWHKTIGKSTYIIVPLLYISVLLLAHSRIDPNDTNLPISLWVPFKDLIIFSVAYGIAIAHRKNRHIHARGMIAAGLVFLEPALVRTIMNLTDTGQSGYLLTIGIVYIIFILLIINDRDSATGRWVFPLILGCYIFVHSVLIFNIQLPLWSSIAHWFAGLNLT